MSTRSTMEIPLKGVVGLEAVFTHGTVTDIRYGFGAGTPGQIEGSGHEESISVPRPGTEVDFQRLVHEYAWARSGKPWPESGRADPCSSHEANIESRKGNYHATSIFHHLHPRGAGTRHRRLFRG